MADTARARGRPRRGGRGFTIFALAGMAMLLALGTWQLDRLQWKRELIEAREAAYARPPVRLTGTAGGADAADWRRVTVAGRFLHEHETLVGPRARQGSPGWHVVTPLRMENGAIVIVDRGWVPEDLRNPAERPESRPLHPVTVEGVIKRPSAPGWFTPENRPSSGQWLHIDPVALAAHWTLDGVMSWWVEAIAQPGGPPHPAGTAGLALPRNNHLQYAITWYSLAVALGLIAVIRARRQTPSDRAR